MRPESMDWTLAVFHPATGIDGLAESWQYPGQDG